MEVAYFERDGGELLRPGLSGPGIDEPSLSPDRLSHRADPGPLAGGDPAIRAFFYPSASLDADGRRPRAFQPDQWIGTNRKRSKGDNVYNLSARDQSLETRVPSGKVVRFLVTLQNDRSVEESPFLRSSRPFRGEKRLCLMAGKNVTASLVSGRLQSRNLLPGEVTGLRISSRGSRAADSTRPRTIHFTASSPRPGIGKDRVRAVLKPLRKRGH